MNTQMMIGCRPIKTKRKPKQLWVLRTHFLRIARNIIESTFNSNVTRGRADGEWVLRHGPEGKEIDVYSIPDRGRYITCDDDLLLQLVAQERERDMERKWTGNENTQQIAALMGLMQSARCNYHHHYNHIKEQYPTIAHNKTREFAERAAVWEWILNTYPTGKKGIREIYFTAYGSIFPDHLKSVGAFDNYRVECTKTGLYGKCVDGRTVAEATKPRISDETKLFIRSLYILPRKLKAKDVHKELEARCGKNGIEYCSLGTVKNYFREFKKNAGDYLLRNGATAAQKIAPYATLIPAQAKNTQWPIDGLVMGFLGPNYQRYTAVIVRDNHSRKIVGYAMGPRENTAVILEAIRNAMEHTGCIAGEIVSDKHSFHKTEIARDLRAATEKMGVVWTVTVNAQRNSVAERYHQYLNDICSEFEGYLGKGIKSKRESSHISDEERERLGKPANWKTEEEIRAILVYAVDKFNNTPLNALGNRTPNEVYEASEDGKCFKLTAQEQLALVRPVKTYLVRRGQITIYVGKTKHEFQLSADLYDRYNNRELLVVYEDLEQGIYITDPKTGEELGDVRPKRKIHGAVHDQTEADKRYLQQLTGRKNGITVKARKRAQAMIVEGLKQNPEAVELINAAILPKDIRQEAMQNMALKLAGINPNLMPIRTANVQRVEVPVPDWKSKAPFAVTGKNENMQRVSIAELIGE